jgi:mono/diheme cytochrome c family protein
MNIKLLFGLIPVVIKKQKMNKKLLFGLIPVLVIALLIPGALTSDSYLNTFEKTYPDAAGSRIDSCELCHINPSGGGPLNSYGTDFANNGHNFTAIESNDSDLDRFPNIGEITAKTFPGNALDNPLTPKQTPALDGATLYSNYCQDCHNPLTSSSKLGATAAQIQIAINTVPEMKSISSLRMVQLQAISTALAVSPTSSPSTALDRAALYASYCQGCHNPLASSTKKGRTADQIKNSISAVSSMNSLSTLNQAQIQAIAIALGSPLTSTSTPTLDGAALYAGNCAGCHSPLASTTKPGRTTAQIQNAINVVSSMNSLSSLSSAQIQAIVAVLGASITPTPTPTPTPTTTTLDGPTLYANYCAGCHSSLASTTKPGRTATQISGAISAVSSMNYLSSLSSTQIQAIATVLTTTPTPTPTPTPTSTTTLTGATLYANYCAGCHSPLASTTKPGRTATQISSAISAVSSMNYLSSLSSTQIQAIATALPGTPTPTPTPTSTTTLTGAALYAGNCAGCHSPLASTTKPGRTATQISSAISAVSSMNYLSSLSSTQIQAIANALPAATPTPTPTSTTTLTGAALYAGNCAGCHNPLASTTKPGRTATQIQNAISAVSSMNFLSSMSSAQIQAIANALPAAPTPTPTPTSTTTLDGPTLYANYCAGCHSPLASTTKPGRTATQISSAITANTGGMGYLSSSLSSTQIQAIANALPAASTPTPTPTSTTTLTGATLYANYCAGCHSPLASTTKPGRTATQISSAITANTGGMGYLSSSLSSTQIQAIATALAAAPIPTDGPSLYASYCAGCHNPLASSDVKRKSASTITSRISSVSEMNYLSSLTSAQIQAIASALATA